MSKVNQRLLMTVVLACSACVWSKAFEQVVSSSSHNQQFSASWWASTDEEERSGFLNGVADCMTWTVHKRGFNQTPEQLMSRITKYYATHRAAAGLNVIEVWQKLNSESKSYPNADGEGEVWKNAHWYLNGDWWMQSREDQQLGFVEGYLWCMKTQASASTDSYSESPRAYWRKINAFVNAHPKMGTESVAVTLQRFRDQGTTSSH